MHPISRILTAMLALGLAMPAVCASTADIRVTGTLVPSACTPTLRISTLHFGTVSSADLHPERPTALTEHTPTLTIQCGTPTLYGLRVVDNRAGSAYGTNGPIGHPCPWPHRACPQPDPDRCRAAGRACHRGVGVSVRRL